MTPPPATTEQVRVLLEWAQYELEAHGGLESEKRRYLDTVRAMLECLPRLRWADLRDEDDEEPQPESPPPPPPTVIIIVAGRDGTVLSAFPVCPTHTWRQLRQRCQRPAGVRWGASIME